MNRTDILERLRRRAELGQPIRTATFTTGVHRLLPMSPLVDLAFISGQLNPLAGLLPVVDQNAVLLDFAKRGLPSKPPFIANICSSDPFRLMDKLVEDIKQAGFVGVQNFPSCGMIDGQFRQRLERSELGYLREVELMVIARACDLLTIALVFDLEEATRMLEAGADVLVVHPGAKVFRKNLSLKAFATAAANLAVKVRHASKTAIVLRYNGTNEVVSV